MKEKEKNYAQYKVSCIHLLALAPSPLYEPRLFPIPTQIEDQL